MTTNPPLTHETQRAMEIARLRDDAERQGRGLDPREVVEWARTNPSTALHRDLWEVDQAELADEARLARVRAYIKVHVRVIERAREQMQVSVQVLGAKAPRTQRPTPTPVYSVPSLRGKGSYVSQETAERDYRQDVLSEAEAHLRTFVRRWGHLSETAEVTRAIEAWLEAQREDAA